jgi:hypothetical protein
MARKKKKKDRPAQPPGPLRWVFDPRIPTKDFFEGMPLTRQWHLQEAVETFVRWLEKGRFLTWEAVVCQEQGIALTGPQKKALGELLNFNDPDDEEDDQVLYIDEFPRPSEPWYTILEKLVPHLLIEPFRTFDVHGDVQVDGWPRIMSALEEHGQDLSLPPGAASYREVLPADLRHRLWLQYCFDMLGGLGQAADLHIEEDDPWRVDELIDRLRECKDSVAHFGLTLESLLTRVIMPERDRAVFVRLMQEKLGLASVQEEIAPRL